jgi:hypothetical protein
VQRAVGGDAPSVSGDASKTHETISAMTARELTNDLLTLLRKEQAAMADFLLALADFDRHQRWREMGHTSLFYFLRRELGLSAGAAQNRKTVAELVQGYPAVEGALRQGKLCLSTVTELSKVLTPENAAETLPRFFGLSRREAEALAVSIKPVPAGRRHGRPRSGAADRASGGAHRAALSIHGAGSSSM